MTSAIMIARLQYSMTERYPGVMDCVRYNSIALGIVPIV